MPVLLKYFIFYDFMEGKIVLGSLVFELFKKRSFLKQVTLSSKAFKRCRNEKVR